MTPAIGVVFPPWYPPEQLRDAARAAEETGVDQLWLWEDCFKESGIAAAAASLAWTERLTVAIGLVPAPLRNVALLAMEVATLERLFPGRFVPVVGHGVQSWMGQVGGRVESPLTLLREYVVALSRLLAGEAVTTSGRYVSLDAVALDWPPQQPVPVLGGGVGPRTLELLGEVASGVLLDSRNSPTDVVAALEQRELRHPCEVPLALGDQAQPVGQVQAQTAQHRVDQLARAKLQEEEIALL